MITQAEIPFLDWSAEKSLPAYLILFALALSWTLLNRWTAQRKLRRRDSENLKLSDPYEICYLTGGPRRVLTYALTELARERRVELLEQSQAEPEILALTEPQPSATDFKSLALGSVASFGKSSASLKQVFAHFRPACSPLEKKLAIDGIRPTSKEAQKGRRAAWPLILVFLLGLAKVLIGLSRDRPVGFLILFLVVTLVMVFILSKPFGISEQAKAQLQALRIAAESKAAKQGGNPLLLFPFIGPAAIENRTGYEKVPASFQKFDPIAATYFTFGGWNDSGSGSFGGDFGDGGSGCSGCGGCGS